MLSRTAYQKQADKRLKTALKLRARYDGRVRKYATALGAALAGAADAKARVDRINLLYGVDVSTETLLVHDLRTAGLPGLLGTSLAASTPGEEVQFFNAIVDGNGGAVLTSDVLFGEVVDPAAPVADAPPVVVAPPVVIQQSPAPAEPAPLVDVPPVVPTPVVDGTVAGQVTLAGPNGTLAGVTIESAPGVSLDFAPLYSGSSTPVDMYLFVFVEDPMTAKVTFADRYAGQPFTVHLADGRTATGLFTEGSYGIDV
ncbi:hypothetical protein Q3A66_16275 [Hymenobacter sp. BT770]|uniref:hypothetical protein n=1 Tax=Hymenobacter sp. BT770 TaxID=2886942 RepID=UPI001D0FF344|nr:hypothetical protein [Hymenobacter sp. BT770]MCC3154572.1 hypothetical protein [Hymenobacter sp. BT770]MDO3416626.1 hypothetical protein [Hymenobacter sp. BT770]